MKRYFDVKTVREEIESVRAELSEKYDIESKYKDFAGLCDEACNMLMARFKDMNNEYGNPVNLYIIHGEIKHSPIAKSKYWHIQHTWILACSNYPKIIDGFKRSLPCNMWIDPTSGQFKYIFDDIPDYLILRDAPSWFYPDRKNPAWNGFSGKINQKLVIHHKIKRNNETVRVSDGIIEFIQYEIWGKISDCIRKIKGLE